MCQPKTVPRKPSPVDNRQSPVFQFAHGKPYEAMTTSPLFRKREGPGVSFPSPVHLCTRSPLHAFTPRIPRGQRLLPAPADGGYGQGRTDGFGYPVKVDSGFAREILNLLGLGGILAPA